MNGIPEYYGQQYAPLHPSRGYAQGENMDAIDTGTMDENITGQAQTLDQIIDQNHQELLRSRASFQPQYSQTTSAEHSRRASMLEFGSSSINNNLNDFQFNPNPDPPSMSTQMPSMGSFNKAMDPRKVRSREALSVDMRFSQMNTPFGSMPNVSSYSPALMSNNTTAGADSSTGFLPHNLEMPIQYDNMMDDTSAIGVGQSDMSNQFYNTSPVDQNGPDPFTSSGNEQGGVVAAPTSAGSGQRPKVSHAAQALPQQLVQQQQQNLRRNRSIQSPVSQGPGGMQSPAQMQNPGSRRQSIDVKSPFPNNGNKDHPYFGSILMD